MSSSRKHIASIVLCALISILIFGCRQSETVAEAEGVPQTGTTYCHNCPQLASGQDTIEFIGQVRRFVAKNVDIGLIENALCDTFHHIPIVKLPVDEFLDIFAKDAGVAKCGLSAAIMAKILLDNGIPAYTYNFGFQDDPSAHVVVLVKLSGKFMVSDPYFNYTLTNADGSDLGLIELLESIANDGPPPFFSTDTVRSEMTVDHTLLVGDNKAILNEPLFKTIFGNAPFVRDSLQKATYVRCFGCDNDPVSYDFINRFEVQLRAKTAFAKFHQAFAMKINRIAGASDEATVNAMVDSVIASYGFDPRIRNSDKL